MPWTSRRSGSRSAGLASGSTPTSPLVSPRKRRTCSPATCGTSSRSSGSPGASAARAWCRTFGPSIRPSGCGRCDSRDARRARDAPGARAPAGRRLELERHRRPAARAPRSGAVARCRRRLGGRRIREAGPADIPPRGRRCSASSRRRPSTWATSTRSTSIGARAAGVRADPHRPGGRLEALRRLPESAGRRRRRPPDRADGVGERRRLGRRHAVDEARGEARVAGRVEERVQVGFPQVGVDPRIVQEEPSERHALLHGVHAQLVDDLVGLLAADVSSQRQHHGLAREAPVQELEVLPHPLRVHVEAGEDSPRRPEHPGQQARGLGQDRLLGHPRPLVPLVGGHQALEGRRNLRVKQSAQRHDVLARRRVALVGHGAGSDLAAVERLLHLRHLGSLELDDLVRDLRQGAADQRVGADGLGDPVPGGMPGDLRDGQAEILADERLELETLLADRREGADPAGELTPEDPRPELGSRMRCRSTSAAHTATLKPKVMGSACCPWVRPAWTVSRWLRARAPRRRRISPRSRVTMACADRSCRTSPVSRMSWVVAPQWMNSAASGAHARARHRIKGMIGWRARSSSCFISSRSRRSTRAFRPISSAAATGMIPRRASARASAASTSSQRWIIARSLHTSRISGVE